MIGSKNFLMWKFFIFLPVLNQTSEKVSPFFASACQHLNTVAKQTAKNSIYQLNQLQTLVYCHLYAIFISLNN